MLKPRLSAAEKARLAELVAARTPFWKICEEIDRDRRRSGATSAICAGCHRRRSDRRCGSRSMSVRRSRGVWRALEGGVAGYKPPNVSTTEPRVADKLRGVSVCRAEAVDLVDGARVVIMSDLVRQRFEASPGAVREARVFLQTAMAGRVDPEVPERAHRGPERTRLERRASCPNPLRGCGDDQRACADRGGGWFDRGACAQGSVGRRRLGSRPRRSGL